MLVAARAGRDNILNAYEQAIEKQLSFLQLWRRYVNHIDDRWLLVKCNFSGAYIVHGAYHPNLTIVEHLA